ncbi:FkbM family methyltransferase [Roseomonas frigidaquae]|uniref:FkbM family methyltransferase n=1 Tax=Falsiroseomonas frigidaquae TaxID=487318 RepID=A0ABX1F7G9_9PROT|nr:FkbM family methyltransferase [Falsiroseomonas frigidaquae]NKE48205.1 FkbM family methyltransferase [Falsiroseomonas frigidaquae]
MNLEALEEFGARISADAKALGPMETKEFSERRKNYPFYGYAEVVTKYVAPFVMFCNNDEVFAYCANWNGAFDYEEHTLRAWSLLCKESSAILDIGAHVGLFSLVAALSNPKAEIDAFEAIDHIFARLFVNAQANRFFKVRPHLAAVSDGEGWIDMNIRSGPRLMSTGASVVDRGKSVAVKRINKISIDNFLQGRPVDLMKIDVEEHEFHVIRGGIKSINMHKPTILAEILTPEILASVTGLVTPLGYDAYWLSEHDGSLSDIKADRPSSSRNVLLRHPSRAIGGLKIPSAKSTSP